MRLDKKSRLRILTAMLIAAAALLLAMSIARGTEYVTNGNFEGGFSAAGVPSEP